MTFVVGLSEDWLAHLPWEIAPPPLHSAVAVVFSSFNYCLAAERIAESMASICCRLIRDWGGGVATCNAFTGYLIRDLGRAGASLAALQALQVDNKFSPTWILTHDIYTFPLQRSFQYIIRRYSAPQNILTTTRPPTRTYRRPRGLLDQLLTVFSIRGIKLTHY